MRAHVVVIAIAWPAAALADEADCKQRGGVWTAARTGTGCRVDGKREGAWETRFVGGQLQLRDTFVEDQRNGPAVKFHASCQIAERGSYVAGEKDGPWVAWTSNGQRWNEGSYRAGSREGTWKFYLDGVAILEGPMVDDAATGKFTESLTTGVKWRTVELRGGKHAHPDAIACQDAGGTWDVDYRAREEGCSKDRVKEGVALGYYEDGKLAWRTEYKQDKENGTRIDYHPTGESLRRGRYVDGHPEGLHEFRDARGTLYGASTIDNGTGAWRAWFANGTLAEEGAFIGGARDGVWRTYHRRGPLIDETAWKVGVMDGPTREYFPTGELRVTGEHRSGGRAGTWNAYYQNAKVGWSGAYDAMGSRTGIWFHGNFNGTTSAIGVMANDQRIGIWTLFHPDGSLAGMGPFVNGEREGRWLEWWPSGELWREVTYKGGREDHPAVLACDASGGTWFSDPAQRALGCQVCRAEKEDDSGPIDQLKIGSWTFWHANGVVEKRGAFVEGKRDEQWQYWFDNGQLTLAGMFRADSEEGAWTGFYRDARKRFEGSYVGGAQDGAWTTFHADGSTAAAGRYAAGKKIGMWTYHHRGGAKKESGEYADGQPTGTWTSFHVNGARESTGAYVAGKRDGEWTWWRPNGAVWRTVRYAAGKEVVPPRPAGALSVSPPRPAGAPLSGERVP